MTRVAIVGATGYAGAELVRLLYSHPDVTLALATSRSHAGQRLDAVFPSFQGHIDLTCEPFSIKRVAEAAEVAFLALPHKLPMGIVPDLLARGVRVIDLSADFRFDDPQAYERAYQPHSAAHLLTEAVYGLSEIYTEEIAAARLIGNPGCYPTSVLLALIPLLRDGLVRPGGIVADAKSGVSGAGRAPSLGTHFCEVAESFRAYKVAAHRHAPEMTAVLSREAGSAVGLTFVPHLVPMIRGMLTTCYARPADGVTASRVLDCWERRYAGRPFVRLCRGERLPDTAHVSGTNHCDLGVRLDAAADRLILVSAIDNLVKGAAGQAVQNMNLMLGLAETRGLDVPARPV